MADKWFFDCAPCGISEGFDTEDQAIKAAEAHIFAVHPQVPSHIRGAEKIGHVQLRTVEEVANEGGDGDQLPMV